MRRTMRTVHWLFVMSVALFISGIGFIIAGARTMRAAAPVDAPLTTPVASIKQIMNGIVMPGATVIYNAVGTTASAAGVVETAPRNDKEWATVGDSAAALADLSRIPERCSGQEQDVPVGGRSFNAQAGAAIRSFVVR